MPHLELSEFQKWYQNGIGIPKNLWFDTSHYLLSLISYFDLRRSLIFGGQNASRIIWGQKRVSEWNRNTKNLLFEIDTSHDLFHWIHTLTSRGKQILTTSRIIRGQKRVSEWNRNTQKPMIWYLTCLIFIDYIFWPFLEVIIEGRSKLRSDICVYISARLMW